MHKLFVHSFLGCGIKVYYKLKPHITLRGWFGVPFSYINHQNNLVYKLSKSECDILNKCDGKNNFIQNDIIDFF